MLDIGNDPSYDLEGIIGRGDQDLPVISSEYGLDPVL
jgi:hypothetical protein